MPVGGRAGNVGPRCRGRVFAGLLRVANDPRRRASPAEACGKTLRPSAVRQPAHLPKPLNLL